MSNPYTIAAIDKNGTMEVSFSGNLIINHIEKIYEEMQELITPEQPVTFIINNPENLDIAFVQMVISVKHKWKAKGSEFHVKSELKEDLKQLMIKTGLEKELNY
ncbi:MAG: hypothetical protein MJZ01_03040 [Bacteroidales bacterium]|nr:hypothetical protein [Bacteroidales bacterium]